MVFSGTFKYAKDSSTTNVRRHGVGFAVNNRVSVNVLRNGDSEIKSMQRVSLVMDLGIPSPAHKRGSAVRFGIAMIHNTWT